ncbi:hypothetical protein CKALI_06000 [Corynebacterium kalinowskii]|uniref:DUF4126 domain-containing protein n=1 Tax=Corynebacterium kalinowskii TaxID=2675216 RepID=A0A6B8VGE3_9CORY|nr:DUF4126 domain-containing protein [Corynebacterium kalinowskii]QGU02069.1 hypothetical protein CKALI_06000 [Corynebacterium kalinowskii]
MGLSTAIGLATSAGLNAYIPLLAYGLLARYTDIVSLPEGWMWLTNPILLVVVGLLLAIELVADKIPAVDSVNDIIQTLIRPTSGGIMFASVFGDQTVSSTEMLSDPQTWILLVVGFVVALVMHLMKSTTRPVINAGTVGIGAPVVSTAENVAAASLTGAALLAPLLVFILLIPVVLGFFWFLSKFRRPKAA